MLSTRASGRHEAAVPTYWAGRPVRGEVVVIPGLCVSRYLHPACYALARLGWRAWLVQPPGWPATRTACGPLDAASLAASVVRALARAPFDDAVLVGQSVGAQVAARVAARAPEFVAHVVLQGPVFDPSLRHLLPATAAWLSDLPRERPSLLGSEVPEWLAVGLGRVRAVLRPALTDPLEETVTGVHAPVSVVVGERDPLSTAAWTRSLVRSGGHHVVLPGMPHSAAHRDPSSFAQAVGGVLAPPTQ